MDGIVLRQLREARKWLTLQQFLQYAVWTLLVALGVLVISRMGPPRLQAFPWIATILISIAIAFAGALWRWKSVRVVARELDARAGTKDRFLTALDLPTIEESLLSECSTPGDFQICSEIAGQRLLASKAALAKRLVAVAATGGTRPY